MKRKTLVRDVSIVAAGWLLWFGLASAGTYLTLRLTSTGQLMADLESARGDRGAFDRVVAGYDDPWTLLVETLPRLLRVVMVFASVGAGVFVGVFASGRSLWPPALAGVTVAWMVAFIDPASAASWFNGGAAAITLWASGLFVMRWRRRRRRAAEA